MRGILRDIARWAVASSIGAAGCVDTHPPFDMSQPEPVADGGKSKPVDRSTTVDPNIDKQPPPVGRVDAGRGTDPLPDAGKVVPPLADWTPIDCAGGNKPRVLANVAFKTPYDYAALYGSHWTGPGFNPSFEVDAGGPPYDATLWLIDQMGAKCATASNPAACDAELSALAMPSATCVDTGDCGPFLVSTAAGAVARIDERAALLALLGAIDSEYKAALVAMFDGHELACPSPSQKVGGQMLLGTRFKKVGDGYDISSEWWGACAPAFGETVHVTAAGDLSVVVPQYVIEQTGCAVGRRPAGLCAPTPARRASALGTFFAAAARLEAASVPAFERLAAELHALGAPAHLTVQALQAALDEVRHARVVGELARRFGAEPQPARVAPWATRAALEIALENAVEGCVRETYGALLAHHQAQTALDPHVRAAMQQIAEDETRHAELSWRVARWLEPRLSTAEQEVLVAARTAALAQLFTELDVGLSPADARAIGFPAPAVGARMLTRLGASLGIA